MQRREQTLQAEERLIEAKAEYTKEQEEEERRLERIADQEKERLKMEQERAKNLARLQEIQDVSKTLAEKRLAAEDRSRQMLIQTLEPIEKSIALTSERLNQNDQMQESIQNQIDSAATLAETDEDRAAAAQAKIEGEKAIAALILERQSIERQGELELAEIKQELTEKELANKKKALDEEVSHLNLISDASVGTFRNTTNAIGALMKATGNENANTIRALFEMNKVASLAEIAFNTAKAITAAQAYPPPLNGAMIASAVAAAAAQGAIVLSQQPPEFHMGGITPDESIAIVKAGEAVLDRSTVDRLGGEAGVNRLQNGQNGQPEIIVMNPYKHFDRFLADRQRAGLSSRSSRRGY